MQESHLQTTLATYTMATGNNTRLASSGVTNFSAGTDGSSLFASSSIASPSPLKLSIDYSSILQLKSSSPSTTSAELVAAETFSTIITVESTVVHAIFPLMVSTAKATRPVATPLSLPSSAMTLRPVATPSSLPPINLFLISTATTATPISASDAHASLNDPISPSAKTDMSPTTLNMDPLGNAQFQGSADASLLKKDGDHTVLIAILAGVLGLVALVSIVVACCWRRSVVRKKWSPRSIQLRRLNTKKSDATLCATTPSPFNKTPTSIDFEKPGMGLPLLHRPGPVVHVREVSPDPEAVKGEEDATTGSKQTGM